MRPERALGILYATIVAVSYAFMSNVAKLIYNYGYSAYGLILFQFLIVTALMWLIAVPDIRKTELGKIRKREWIDLSIVGALWGIMTMSYFFALEMLPVSLAIVLYFLYPVLVPILKLLFERQKPATYVIISLVMTFGGVLLGASVSGETLKNVSVQGVILGLASAIFFALFIYYYDRPVYTMPSYLSTAVVISATTVFIAVFSPFLPIKHPLDGKFLLFSLLVGVLAQLVPVLLIQFAIRRIGSVLASIIQTSELPLTIMLAFLFFQEQIKPIQIVGIILILAGIVYSNMKGRVQPVGQVSNSVTRDS